MESGPEEKVRLLALCGDSMAGSIHFFVIFVDAFGRAGN
jgi:hypothetical protein